MTNSKGFRENFDEMVFRNLENMTTDKFETEEYKEVSKEVEDLYEMIKKLLPVKYKGLIKEYEEEKTFKQALEEKVIYEQGLKDGAKLITMLSE